VTAREEPLEVSVARSEAIRLAKRIGDLDVEIKANGSRITELVQISEAAPLLQEARFGPVTGAICLTAWSHQGGYVPRRLSLFWPGSTPFRLHREIPFVIGSTAEATGHGLKPFTKKEIRRCVKRYLARRIYRTLNANSLMPSLR
jgi:transposase